MKLKRLIQSLDSIYECAELNRKLLLWVLPSYEYETRVGKINMI